jgi:hypothetical protein
VVSRRPEGCGSRGCGRFLVRVIVFGRQKRAASNPERPGLLPTCIFMGPMGWVLAGGGRRPGGGGAGGGAAADSER